MNATINESAPAIVKLSVLGQNTYQSEAGRVFKIGDNYDTFLKRAGISPSDTASRDFVHVRQFAWSHAAETAIASKRLEKVSVRAVWSKKHGWQEISTLTYKGGTPTAADAQAAIEKTRSQTEKRLLAMAGDAARLLE